jgi:hypothetical protein
MDCSTASITSGPSAFGSEDSQNPEIPAFGDSLRRSVWVTVNNSRPVAR